MMSNVGNSGYAERMQRFDDAVSLREPDWVPVIPWNFHFFPAVQAGMSFRDAMNDHQAYYDALKEETLRYDFDMAPDSSVHAAPLFRAAGLKTWKWPGDGLPDHRTFQYQESEIMLAEEYDRFLADPEGFTMRVLWPRVSQTLEPLQGFPPLINYFNYPHLLAPFFASPQAIEMLERLVTLGKEWLRHNKIQTQCFADLEALGYPRTYATVIYPPFDIVSVFLRGMHGTALDMYRHPDKLLAAVDICMQMQLDIGLTVTSITQNPRISIFAYRGAGGFMSNEQFERFYWPSLLKLIQGFLDQDLVPVVFFEGDFTPRLGYLGDLPSRRVPIHFDIVDRTKAHQALKDRNCFYGNVPIPLLEHGTPQQVEDDVKELIDLFAPGGGLIIDGAGAISDSSKPENVRAMVETARRYGAHG